MTADAKRRSWIAAGAAACAAALFLAAFVWLAHETSSGGVIAGWDGRVTDAFVAVRSPLWDRVFWAVTLLGNTPLMAAYLSAAVLILLAWGRWGSALLLGGGVALAQLVSMGTKAALDRPRPPVSLALVQQPASDSLPSGHALTTMVAATLLVFLLFSWTRKQSPKGRGSRWIWTVRGFGVVVAALLTMAVGVSRVYLGVHWASDVIGGWCLGAVCSAFVLGPAWLWRSRTRDSTALILGPRPRLTRRLRLVLVTVMILVVAAVAVASGLADPMV